MWELDLVFAGTWVGTDGTVTAGLFLGGTGADCIPICWCTAVWLTYGVGGMVACGVQGDAVCCLLYTSPSPRDATLSRMPSSA